ncbi:MAG: TRAP transporter substrate-binding protein [Gammaproteobacteria bacterium]|jgi:C4-dicarboxylate-binding protein DctP
MSDSSLVRFLNTVPGSIPVTTWVAILMLSIPVAASAQSIVIKFPHDLAPTTPKGLGANYFEQIVEERLPGRVDVEVYPSSSLMNDQASLEALAFGEIQMIAISLSKLDRLTKRFQIFDLPFLFADMNQVEAFQNSDVGAMLLEELTPRGIKGLSYWHNGQKQLTANVPLRVPEDAEGLEFRIMDSDVLLEEIRAIGGNPQKMPYSEVYQALQTGAINAQENTWSNIYASKFYEVQEYITESNHGYIGYLVAVNPQFWDGLPGDVRNVLDAALRETTEYVNSIAQQVNENARNEVLTSGRNSLIELSEQERTRWRTTMRPVWDLFAGDIGPEILEAAAESRSR